MRGRRIGTDPDETTACSLHATLHIAPRLLHLGARTDDVSTSPRQRLCHRQPDATPCSVRRQAGRTDRTSLRSRVYAARGVIAIDTEADELHSNRNLVWRHFVGDGSRVRHGGVEQEAYEHAFVADLRLASIKHPDDRQLEILIDRLRVESSTFDFVWSRFEALPRSASRKTITHPSVGALTLDCEVLTVTGSDLQIIVFTAAPGPRDAVNLDCSG